MKFFVLAGEASGDQIGAKIISALRQRYPQAQIEGIGGAEMKKAGLKKSFIPIESLSYMGIIEVVSHLPQILNSLKKTRQYIEKNRFSHVITIDVPDFSFRLQNLLKKKRTAIKHYHIVAPTVWAWREKRAEKISKFLDGLLCLFPFEPPYFKKVGLKALYAPHPITEENLDKISQNQARTELNLDQNKHILGVFLGSRKSEIERHGDIFFQAIRRVRQEKKDIQIITLTLPHLKRQIETLAQKYNIPIVIFSDSRQKHPVMRSCNHAIAVSGTIAFELSFARIPHFIAYKMNKMTYEVAKHIVKTPYAHLTNVILEGAIVPELIQGSCTIEKCAAQITTLIEDKSAAQHQLDAFENLIKTMTLNKESSFEDKFLELIAK